MNDDFKHWCSKRDLPVNNWMLKTGLQNWMAEFWIYNSFNLNACKWNWLLICQIWPKKTLLFTPCPKLISLVVSAECSLMLMFYLKLILENTLVEKCAYAIRAQYYKACKQRMLLSWNKLPAKMSERLHCCNWFPSNFLSSILCS